MTKEMREEPAGTATVQNHSLVELIAFEKKRQAARKRRQWLMIIAAVLAAIAVWYFFIRTKPIPFADRFRLSSPSYGNVVRQVRATGTLEAVTTVEIGAEVSGRIASVYADFNDRVKKGQILAVFDRTLLNAEYLQAEKAARAAAGSLEQARTTKDKAALDFARSKELYDKKLMSQSDFESITAQMRSAEEAVLSAESQLSSLEAAATAAHTNLAHGVIYSPIDGVVITRNIDSGQTLASIFQTPVLFTVAADLHKMQVVAAVDEADIGEVAVGQHASFSVNAYPDRVFEGVVTQVRNSPVIVQDVVTYGVVVTVENADLSLKPGMTASVRVDIASVSNVLRTSAQSIRFTPPGKNAAATPSVWVLSGDSLRRVDVRPGISDGELTQIAAGTLTPAEKVVDELSTEGKKVYGVKK